MYMYIVFSMHIPVSLQVSRAPTIEEELLYSPSPSPLPPSPPASPIPPSSPLLAPAMLDFSERESQADMRMRVSSVSGRPIRSTGICLQFGEEESSSDSEEEGSNESGGPLSLRAVVSRVSPCHRGR